MGRKRKAKASPQGPPTRAKRRSRRSEKSKFPTSEKPSETPEPSDEAKESKPGSPIASSTEKQNDDDIGAGRSYFEAHRGAVRTSNLTLASMTIASQTELEQALFNLHNPLQDEQVSQAQTLRSKFGQYLYMLSAGHSLLFYGYGSKRLILDELAEFLAETHAVVIAHGFNPTCSLRTVLSQLTGEVLGISGFSKRTLLDYVDAIKEGIGRRRIALVIHNMDGAPFRGQEMQNALAMLSTLEGVSIVASIDHVNAPLLWDGAAYSKFRWAWIKADTFKAYTAETVYCSKPLLRGGNERRIEGAVALLQSLSERARQVFRELAERQVGRKGGDGEPEEVNHKRTTFNQLFDAAKEKFLASDPATLRIILTELQTHDLLQSRRGADAAEQMWVPLQAEQLHEVLSAIGPE